jgi:hypothetical protein
MAGQKHDPPTEDTPRKRSRLEDEVLEILTRADQPPTPFDRLRSRMRHARARRRLSIVGSKPARRISNGVWLLASVVAAILALIVDDWSVLLARVLAIICIVCFAIPIINRWRRPEEPDIKRWRGRDIDFRGGPPDLIDDLRRRFRRPPKR